MAEAGIIRRIGAVFDTRRLGFASTLIAMQVPTERVDEVAGIVSSYSGVSHNYLRGADYNLWFTLYAESEQDLAAIIEEIKHRTGIEDVLNLPALKVHKIRVEIDVNHRPSGPNEQEGCR
jgi:DNA-binding Lrp family transcriptional regulator